MLEIIVHKLARFNFIPRKLRDYLMLSFSSMPMKEIVPGASFDSIEKTAINYNSKEVSNWYLENYPPRKFDTKRLFFICCGN
jgi:hypothetical protein